MKPSERRALEAEKRAQREAEARERELTAEKKEDTQKDQPLAEEGDGAPEIKADEKPYRRKEGFFQSHIRLITFIITATLILTVFGPLGVDMLVAAKNDKIVNNKEDISIETVYKIYDLYDSVHWGSFKNFNYTDYSDKVEGNLVYEREYPVKDSRLVVKAGGSSMSDKPEYIYLIDYRDGILIDLKKEDPRDYVKQMED
ncbi:MAG: hypothetical protein J6L83_01030 [Clostridia bacterium]|nr:hypothetical protein [Clostridia bacterium]